MTQSKEHTPLKIAYDGDAEKSRPAIIQGDLVRIHVDCSENYDDPKPIAEKIVKSFNNYERVLQESARLREALEKIVAMKPEVHNGETIYSIYPGAPSWPQRVAKEALESPRGESPSTKGSGEVVEHVVEEGSREHVISYSSNGRRCSEPKCEVNK